MQLSLCIISIPALETGMIFIWAFLSFFLPLPLPLNLELWQSIQAILSSTFFATFSTDNLLSCLLMKNDKTGQSTHLSPLSSPPFSHFGLLILVRVLVGNPHPHSSDFALLITSAASKWFCLMDLVALTTDVFTAASNSSRGYLWFRNSAVLACILQHVYKARRGTDCGGMVSPNGFQICDLNPAETRLDFYGNWEPLGTWHLVIGSRLKPRPGYSPSLHWGTNIPAVECQYWVEHSLLLRRKGEMILQS